jgi:hypothetical protein
VTHFAAIALVNGNEILLCAVNEVMDELRVDASDLPTGQRILLRSE